MREKVNDFQQKLDGKDQSINELEAELKVLRNERESFVEMQVRMEIQHKELGLIMRE